MKIGVTVPELDNFLWIRVGQFFGLSKNNFKSLFSSNSYMWIPKKYKWCLDYFMFLPHCGLKYTTVQCFCVEIISYSEFQIFGQIEVFSFF